ncbi:hypothetical protein IKE84_01675 [Candidatus Saccharibacteria bacterium]|nr:hypothetical protein [Candidatus Saccharibacteria bacterium]
MVGEKANSRSPENTSENSDASGENSKYPPFDPEKAKELVAQARILQSAEQISDDGLRQRVIDNENMLKERQERINRDEEIEKLANEAEARLGRNLSQSELQDLANKYNAQFQDQDTKAKQSSENDMETPSFDPTLYANESEWRAANPDKQKGEKLRANPEYDFRNVDKYQEATFVLAAANSLVDSPDIAYIDSIALKIGDKATENKTSVFEALKQSVKESDTDEKGGFAATDLLNAFIDTTSTYVASKDEKIGRGFAKGLLTSLEMRIDGFATDKSNPYIDALRVDLSIIKPLADEFIKNYDAPYDSPNAFRDYLRNELEMQEIDMRSAKRRGEQISSDAERTVQAIKSAMAKLEEMQSSYNKSLKNLQDTAYANHRVIK